MTRLAGRNIIVTGAAQGLGAAFALRVAAEGAKVGLCDIRVPSHTLELIQARGGRGIAMACDVTDPHAVKELAARTDGELGGIHGLVNNAALFAALPKRSIEEIESSEFDRVMAVNVRGAFECVKAVVPFMKRQAYGKIVSIASGTVFKGQTMMLPYVTSKGAIVAMTKCLARELGGFGIRANCLAPGFTLSDGVKGQPEWIEAGKATVASRALKRDQTPDDLTGSLAHLLSADSDFMTGQTLIVDGGSVMH